MDLNHKSQQKKVRFNSQPSDEDKQIDGKTRERETIISNKGSTDMVIVFPMNNYGTDIMGDPAHPSANPNNKLAATWKAPLPLQPAKAPHEDAEIGSHSGHINPQSRNMSPPMQEVSSNPTVPSSPYVLDGTEVSRDSSAKCNFLAFQSLICRIDGVFHTLNRWSKNAETLVDNILIHMKLGGSMPETVWSKVSLGAKIVAEGGLENIFKLSFSVGPSEKLLKTSSCYLSTSTGPVAGLLFISTEKLAFCSDNPLRYTTSDGRTRWSEYRVVIPVGRLKAVIPCENIAKPAEKYIQVETVDNHEFWFMGFVNYQKALRYLWKSVRVH
ncbi:putative GEM-like protein 8 isoform X2 [Cryptomeria japonica]|uniref:putative GEM-like protein 8 isoform X2 n=1 Tax=Cryptomeria japonica TaxID=3369 RepID=UPI0025ABE855|nr:putative GEM-like protein 8 isoform X2 [Cryptomeria japonica]